MGHFTAFGVYVRRTPNMPWELKSIVLSERAARRQAVGLREEGHEAAWLGAHTEDDVRRDLMPSFVPDPETLELRSEA